MYFYGDFDLFRFCFVCLCKLDVVYKRIILGNYVVDSLFVMLSVLLNRQVNTYFSLVLFIFL